nr:unnamed protein product [Callosobruchus analis]
MKADIFFDYIVKGLSKWVDDQNIQKPVLVFVDGHKSHLTMRLSEYCDQHGIILYALPPNATHMIQPADESEVTILNVNCHQFHDSDKECTNKDELIPIYDNPENYIGTNAMEPELNMIQNNIEENEENIAEARLDIENNRLINNMEKISVECTLQPNIANTNAKKVHTANLQIENKESSKIKPIICSNVIIKSTNPSPILKKHLVLPDETTTTAKIRGNHLEIEKHLYNAEELENLQQLADKDSEESPDEEVPGQSGTTESKTIIQKGKGAKSSIARKRVVENKV